MMSASSKVLFLLSNEQLKASPQSNIYGSLWIQIDECTTYWWKNDLNVMLIVCLGKQKLYDSFSKKGNGTFNITGDIFFNRL